MTSGIYQIVNKTNSKRYIGSSVDSERRWFWHRSRLNKNKHYNAYLQNAWNKSGEDCFIFEVIEEDDRLNVIEREQYYLDVLKPSYNISESATGGDLGAEVRKKLSIASKDNKANLGKKFSAEHKAKIGLSNKGKRKGVLSSKETCLKMSLARSGERHWNFGKHHSLETKMKISNTLKSNY
jgi:group I intron endonuclease